MRAVVMTLVLGAVALGAAGCGGGGSSSGSGSGKTELDMDNYFFDPGSVKADAGKKITLELTNGSMLAKVLAQGAAGWLKRPGASTPQRLVDEIYLAGLGRRPTAEEARVAGDLVGSPPTPAGVEDLLWVMVMLPEFQLIN